MSLFEELKRRHVFRVGAAYAVLAWLLIQVIDTVLPRFGAPDWVITTLMLILLLGFPVSLIMAWVFEFTSEGIKTQQAADATHTTTSGSRLNAIIMTLMVLAVVFMAVDNYLLDDSTAEIALPSQPQVEATGEDITTTATLEKSIAVLPFTNLSNDPDQEYFSDGLSEEILNKLAQVDDLLVAARTSSFFYKDRNEDMRTIGEAMGVSYLLEGSVRRAGDSLRINAQLVQADNGFQLWSETFNRQLADVFAIQDEIAEAVTTALRVTLGTDEFALPGSTRNIEAYQHYLQGIALSNQGGQINENVSGDAAVEELRQAVTADPEFARAWLELARTLRRQAFLAPTGERRNLIAMSQEALDQARAAAPDMPELRLVDLGIVNDRSNLALAEFESRLLSLMDTQGSIQADLTQRYAGFLLSVGRVREALTYAEQANRLNPMDLSVHNQLGFILLSLNRLDDALAIVNRADQFIGDGLGGVMPAVEWAVADIREGPAAWADKAFAFYETRSSAPAAEFNLQAARWMIAEDRETAAAELRAYAFDPSTPEAYSLISARHANSMGEPQLALDIMLAFDTGIALWDVQGAAMRQLPGFKDLVQQLGLVDYWRTTGNWPDYCRSLDGNDDFECF